MKIPVSNSEPVVIYFERLEPDNFFRGVAQRTRRTRERELKRKAVQVQSTFRALATMVANGSMR